jgi:hypothetical protein
MTTPCKETEESANKVGQEFERQTQERTSELIELVNNYSFAIFELIV